MSMREYQTILQEMGLASASPMNGGSDGDMGTIRVEHVLVLRLDEKWETIMAHAVAVLLKQGQKLILPLKVMAYATSACLVLYGTAKLVQAFHPTTVATATPSSSSSSSNDANRPNQQNDSS